MTSVSPGEDCSVRIFGVDFGVIGVTCSSVFGDSENDGVVKLFSQRGGLSGERTFNVANQQHGGSVEHPAMVENVRQVLSLNPVGPRFGLYGFTPINLPMPPVGKARWAPIPRAIAAMAPSRSLHHPGGANTHRAILSILRWDLRGR